MPGPIATTVIGLRQLLQAAALDRSQCDAAAVGFGQRLGHQLGGKRRDAGQARASVWRRC